jgi:hypothetical protein
MKTDRGHTPRTMSCTDGAMDVDVAADAVAVFAECHAADWLLALGRALKWVVDKELYDFMDGAERRLFESVFGRQDRIGE